jgi:hypothetical protein
MPYTYEELRHQTVAQLREIAAGLHHEAVQGYTQMHKTPLIIALCKALGIDWHEHHRAVGDNKTVIKSQISELKKKRDEAIAAHDHAQLHLIRRRIHRLKRDLHKATV